MQGAWNLRNERRSIWRPNSESDPKRFRARILAGSITGDRRIPSDSMIGNSFLIETHS